jgi:uncharacterized membrane protein
MESTGTQTRIRSIDALRGLIMIVMALDHTREYFNRSAFQFQPDDLSRTSAALFFTRWITHFCAPVFFFTAGLGAFFWLTHGRTPKQLTRFLVTRGLWLVVLELTVLRLLMYFSLFKGFVALTILWALGWSMVALGFLARLPVRVLAVLSILTIVLHNLADPVSATQFGGAAWIWNLLHELGVFKAGSVTFLVAYPLVPWFAVMAAGYCFGQVVALEGEARRRWMIRIGCGLTLAFLIIRWINIYGDPAPWSTKFPGMTVLSFLRVNKYPPSLDFLLMTLGPAILLLGLLDKVRFSDKNPLIVFGRVPLFYFLLHFFVIHLLAILFALVRYGRADFLLHPSPSLGGPAGLFPTDYGYSLGVTYLVWISVVIMVYPLCRWYSRVKARRNDWWLSYL